MLGDNIFRNSEKQENQIDVRINGRYQFFPGVWPLLDENEKLTNFVAIGNKNGVPWEKLYEFKAQFPNKFKYIYSCQNGPVLVGDYSRIEREFDGVFDTDYKVRSKKRLNCNHSMMVRSFSYNKFFWESGVCRKEYDFNILTTSKLGSKTKRWDRGEKICNYLCEQGFKGAVYSQTGNSSSLISKRLGKYVTSGSLVVRDGIFSSEEFHREADKALCTIFPNNIDAFPKFMIESLLANRFIVISSDLLLGRRFLNSIGVSNVMELDFDKLNYRQVEEKLLSLREGCRVDSRKVWLDKYSFVKVTEAWAGEFNRVFKTRFKRLYFLNHIPRLRKVV